MIKPIKPIAELLKKRASAVEAALVRALQPSAENAALRRLEEAMLYAATGGGKRLRPFLLIETAALFGADHEAMPAALAIEMVHAYSLVHDDLPAMDDAETRRGRPSVHMAFDEAIAILAGDGLLTESFVTLAAYPPDRAAALMAVLAEAAGKKGMVGGQMMDLFPGEGSEAEISTMQDLKTGALIAGAVHMGAVVGGASDADRQALGRYGAHLGLAFQIADDLLDVSATAEEAGKPVGRDDAQGKTNFLTLFGEDGARRRLAAINNKAREALAQVEADTSTLEDLLDWQANRTS